MRHRSNLVHFITFKEKRPEDNFRVTTPIDGKFNAGLDYIVMEAVRGYR